MIKSPKEKFQAQAQRRDEWEKIVQTRTFEEACDYALLQMNENMPPLHETAFHSHEQMMGALIFLRTLKTIHEIQQPPTKPTEQGLNYQAGV